MGFGVYETNVATGAGSGKCRGRQITISGRLWYLRMF